MADDGLNALEDLIQRPRRVTPSLAGSRRPEAGAAAGRSPEVESPPPHEVPKPRRVKVPSSRVSEVSTQEGTERPTFAARKVQVQLRSEQEEWLHRILADGLREGVRVSEADVVRVAMDRLREGKAGWSELREAILVETKQRARRR